MLLFLVLFMVGSELDGMRQSYIKMEPKRTESNGTEQNGAKQRAAVRNVIEQRRAE